MTTDHGPCARAAQSQCSIAFARTRGWSPKVSAPIGTGHRVDESLRVDLSGSGVVGRLEAWVGAAAVVGRGGRVRGGQLSEQHRGGDGAAEKPDQGQPRGARGTFVRAVDLIWFAHVPGLVPTHQPTGERSLLSHWAGDSTVPLSASARSASIASSVVAGLSKPMQVTSSGADSQTRAPEF